jgi:YbgC/YbaW family acyl-CoA thioester hydrolase
MPYEYKTIRRVEFSETDMAGLMHFSNYFRFMETVEQRFFRSLGMSVFKGGDPPVSFPRVHAECDYKIPLHFEDEVEIHLLVAEKKKKALTFVFKFRKLNAAPPVQVAQGALTVVCVRHEADDSMAVCPIPESLAGQIQIAPVELLAAQ